jgi:hypothetical protein
VSSPSCRVGRYSCCWSGRRYEVPPDLLPLRSVSSPSSHTSCTPQAWGGTGRAGQGCGMALVASIMAAPVVNVATSRRSSRGCGTLAQRKAWTVDALLSRGEYDLPASGTILSAGRGHTERGHVWMVAFSGQAGPYRGRAGSPSPPLSPETSSTLLNARYHQAPPDQNPPLW